MQFLQQSMNSTGLNVHIVPGLVDIILSVLQVDHFPRQINILGECAHFLYSASAEHPYFYTEGKEQVLVTLWLISGRHYNSYVV